MVLIGHGPVWSRSFSGPVTGLPNTTADYSLLHTICAMNGTGKLHTIEADQALRQRGFKWVCSPDGEM